MAVTQSSDGNTKQLVNNGAELSCREGAVADARRHIQLRKTDGTSNGCREINKDGSEIVKSYKVKKNQTKDDKSDSVSDIDDAEVSGYLNNKEEIYYKTILWEAINGNYKKPKKRKRATETKKVVSAERAAKTSEEVEVQKLSTKINYDALKLLNSELAEGSENAQTFTEDFYRSEHSPQENLGHGMHQSKECSNNEDWHDTSSFQDNDGFGYHDSEIENTYTDEHIDDEYFDF